MMKNSVKRIVATVAMTAVCLGATMQIGLPQVAYAVNEDADAPVMITIDGTEVRQGEYADYFSYCKTMIESNSGMGPYVWSMYPDALQQLIEATDQNCLYARVVVDHFNELGLKLDRDTAWNYKSTMNKTKTELQKQGMDFDSWLSSMGMDEEFYNNIFAQGYYLEALDEYYFGVGGEKAPSEDELRAEFDKYYKAKHILIRNTDDEGNELTGDALAEKQKLAQELQDRINAGEDFDELMNEYSEDTGLQFSPEGYIFQDDGTYVEGFVNGVKALQPGETSKELVESEFGWHIIRREPLTDEDYQSMRPDLVYALTGESIDDLLNTWMEEAQIEYPEGHENLTIADVLGEEAGAVPDISELLGGSTSSGAASSSAASSSASAASSAE
ncbi:peptidylprolyl isomerase [Intestinibacillus sp. Marseille-P6563]|uniref:peptidylprolyl isomerase n=1 Tax=Intestinibacillus sp. Marseille-P6563 TaxID=2364792 RepID=UPI000F04C4EC|nr:peptidylprolyl isomerase [Intestinibacillus sp. Marseille-P6563]